jgi:hypothetical protein
MLYDVGNSSLESLVGAHDGLVGAGLFGVHLTRPPHRSKRATRFALADKALPTADAIRLTDS